MHSLAKDSSINSLYFDLQIYTARLSVEKDLIAFLPVCLGFGAFAFQPRKL